MVVTGPVSWRPHLGIHCPITLPLRFDPAPLCTETRIGRAMVGLPDLCLRSEQRADIFLHCAELCRYTGIFLHSTAR